MMYSLSQWIFFFYIYCFLGWIWESALVSFLERRPVNRGFMKGPFLPIYGSGALCVLLVTIPFRGNPALMFASGMVAATVLEYVTGAVMERLFRVRYWDYSDKFLNVNGYICLKSTACWGAMTILVVEVFHPPIARWVLSVSAEYIELADFVLTPFITADFVTSFVTALHLRDILIQNERIQAELLRLSEKMQELEDALSETKGKAKEQIQQEKQELLLKIGEMRGRIAAPGKAVRGLLARNPRAISFWHKESFTEIKRNLKEKIGDINIKDILDAK